MQLNETNSVAVNEYGSNLLRRKLDPLVVLEAKAAMSKRGDKEGEGYKMASKILDTIVEEEERIRDNTAKAQEEVLSRRAARE
jgi:hypothetical protein